MKWKEKKRVWICNTLLALVGVEEAITNPECAVSTLTHLPTPQLLSLGSHTKSLVLGLRLPTLQEFEELPVIPSLSQLRVR